MIIEVASATISHGKRSEAEDLWKRIASYDKKQPGVEDCIVMRPLQGLFSALVMSTRFSSMAAWEELRKAREKDPEWLALGNEWIEKQYTVPLTLEFKQYEVVE